MIESRLEYWLESDAGGLGSSLMTATLTLSHVCAQIMALEETANMHSMTGAGEKAAEKLSVCQRKCQELSDRCQLARASPEHTQVITWHLDS